MFLALQLIKLILLEETAGNVSYSSLSISLSQGYFLKLKWFCSTCLFIFSEILVFIAFFGSFLDLGGYNVRYTLAFFGFLRVCELRRRRAF